MKRLFFCLRRIRQALVCFSCFFRRRNKVGAGTTTLAARQTGIQTRSYREIRRLFSSSRRSNSYCRSKGTLSTETQCSDLKFWDCGHHIITGKSVYRRSIFVFSIFFKPFEDISSHDSINRAKEKNCEQLKIYSLMTISQTFNLNPLWSFWLQPFLCFYAQKFKKSRSIHWLWFMWLWKERLGSHVCNQTSHHLSWCFSQLLFIVIRHA